MTRVSTALRQIIRDRAQNCCEYCRLDEADAFFSYEIDHIIAEKHGGATAEDNLCLSCFECNRFKGSDIASLDPDTGEIAPLFHPRRDRWQAHFRLDGPTIVPLTPEGRVTVDLLRLNSASRVEERERLIALRRYPCPGETAG